MGDLGWTHKGVFTVPLSALRHHAVAFGTPGSGKTETLYRVAYAARRAYKLQVIFLDAKGESKREDEESEDNAARFVAAMRLAGAEKIAVYPATSYHGWQGTPQELKNRLLSVVDYSESAYYGDVAANALDLALGAPTTPRSSGHLLANLRLDRLKLIYKDEKPQLQRVLQLDKHLLQQVEMRYQVFFSAVSGTLDGTLDYADADAVYLRVRGFALRNEAPRLGRFLIADFMHYMAERRRPGVQTLFIIDEYNTLRMREETSALYELVRSFGGCLIISTQGYAGLGPREYAERILDSSSTSIVHACSDPGPIIRRAGKSLRLDVSWSEDEEGLPRKHIRPVYDWKIKETAVMQQEAGQAFWISRGRFQQVQSARLQLPGELINAAWKEIREQEAMQRQRCEQEATRSQEQQAKRKEPTGGKKPKSDVSGNTSSANTSQKPGSSVNRGQTAHLSTSASPSPAFQTPDPDDDEPDRL